VVIDYVILFNCFYENDLRLTMMVSIKQPIIG